MNVVEINDPPAFSPGFWRSGSVESAWVGAATSHTQINADQLSHLLSPGPEFTLSIELPAFGTKLTGEIVDLQSTNEYTELTFKSVVDVGVSALLVIRSEASAGADDDLQIKEASLSFQVSEHRARPLFITDTLYSMLGLGGMVKVLIPSVNIDLTLRFNVRLADLSELLQRRKMYFGLMVIEKATGKAFQVPEYISGEDMSAIFFAGRAILDRQFIWRVNEIIQPTPANDETFNWFQNLETVTPETQAFKLMFGPIPKLSVILGEEISLGTQTVFLEDAFIEDHESVGSSLALKDGRIVTIRIRPLSRVGRYVLTNPPTLPSNSWDRSVRQFIELDGHLSQALMTRYLTLMSLVVPELPPEQMYALINPETIALLAEQAHDRRTPVDEYLSSLLTENQNLPFPVQASEEQFDADMADFAEGTDNLQPYTGFYSRSDIYFDHD
ncbi:MAG TPA: hypothetical protein VGO56_07185 [Pyrinomonadaceae bacterium]|jgi:hypothetical protein|nr:hypothetical protein [Pyrinomonadaceae bacterium]